MEQVAPLHPPSTFSFPQVLLAATHITAVGWRCTGCSDCGTRRNVRQCRDPHAKAVPSGVWWDVAGCHLSHGPAVGCGGWPLSCGGLWQGATSPMAPWWDMAQIPLFPGPVVGHGMVPPLPCWVMAGCHLSCGPTVGCGMDPPLLWPHGRMWQGVPYPVARCCMVPPPQRTGLPVHTGMGSAPPGSMWQVPACPHSLPASAQLDNSILSLGSLGLKPLGVKGSGVLPPYQTPLLTHRRVLEPA